MQLKNETNSLRQKLDALVSAERPLKDSVFQKNKIIAALKRERDSITRKVKELKQKRDSLNRNLSEGIKSIKSMKEATRKIIEKYKIKNPYGIKKEIEALEFKIETEALSPKKEEELMKVIKTRKKVYNELTKGDSGFAKIAETGKGLDTTRDEAENYHRQLQELAKQGQEKHEKMIVLAKEIDPLKKKLSETSKEHDIAKMNFVIKNSEFMEKLKQLASLGLSAKEFQHERKEKRQFRERGRESMPRQPNPGMDRRRENEAIIEKKKKRG